ncbi:MAG TPA: ABC transporter permease [Candidatus Latescibacteria bacterium]|nr:ABC transporter permease [Candidatus Latescibacterota bacterium]
MLKTSLTFLGIAFLCLFFADIEVITGTPWREIDRILLGYGTPDLPILYTFREALLNTLTFAFCGITLGVGAGAVLALFFHVPAVRLFCAFIRAVHEIFWAFLLLPIVGLNPVCGILAIGIPYSGVFAKVYAEIFQEADQRPIAGIPTDTHAISRFLYGVLPVTIADLKNYTTYRFECGLRSSAILGFIGLPTLGFHLETAFRESLYSEVAALLYLFYFLIASLRYWLKPRLVPIYVALSVYLVSKDISVTWANITRFLTYEILPWPMRREGFLAGTGEVTFPVDKVWDWAVLILMEEGIPGLWNTIILTQIVLVGTGVFTLVGFSIVCRHFVSPRVARASAFLHIILRTTPEYIMAYAFIQLWGPSMLPAILAILLHNGGILSHLTGQNANLIMLRMDSPTKRVNRYFFEVLPRVYGQFLAFLFYRWEVMMRESAILGILGIYTLGFFIDSAIADDKLDKAVLLILITAVLNMGIDTVSQTIRKSLRISTGKVITIRE